MASSASTFTIRYKLLSFFSLVFFSGITVIYRRYVLETGTGETACAVLTALVCVVLLCLALVFGNKFEPSLPHGQLSVTFGASVAAFLLLTTLASSVYFAHFAPLEERITDLNSTISFLVKLFALLSVVYFLLTAASMSLQRKKALHLGFAMAPILFYAFRILNDFIDNSTMPLANSGGYHILSMIATMLFFLAEGKFIIGNAKVGIYLALGQIAILLNATYNIPLLFSCIGGGVSRMDAIYALLSVALMIYIATRLFSLRAHEPALPEEPLSEAEESTAEEEE